MTTSQIGRAFFTKLSHYNDFDFCAPIYKILRISQDIKLLKLIDQSKIERSEYDLFKHTRELVFPHIPS